MSIYRKLNEEFDNSGCDSISCYANITANVLNETFDYDSMIMVGGALLGLTALVGFLWLMHRMSEAQLKDIQRIISIHLTKDELNTVKNLISRDPIIKNAVREINKQKELDRNLNQIDLKNETANVIKKTMTTFYKEDKINRLKMDIELRIKDVLPKDLYEKYQDADDAVYSKYGIHFAY